MDGLLYFARGPTFFENVIVDRIHGPKCFAGDLRTWHAHTECFLHAHDQFERVDGIKTETIGAEQRKVVPDLVRSCLKHQIFYQHLLDVGAQIGVGHKEVAILSQVVTQVNRAGKILFDQQFAQPHFRQATD